MLCADRTGGVRGKCGGQRVRFYRYYTAKHAKKQAETWKKTSFRRKKRLFGTISGDSERWTDTFPTRPATAFSPGIRSPPFPVINMSAASRRHRANFGVTKTSAFFTISRSFGLTFRENRDMFYEKSFSYRRAGKRYENKSGSPGTERSGSTWIEPYLIQSERRS